jgi:hypothetical protein
MSLFWAHKIQFDIVDEPLSTPPLEDMGFRLNSGESMLVEYESSQYIISFFRNGEPCEQLFDKNCFDSKIGNKISKIA